MSIAEIGTISKKKAKVFPKVIIGTMNYHNNDKYEGEWANDQKNGEGKFAEIKV